MYKLLYTDNVEFDLKDWENLGIKRVFAGENCVMAITENGKVLQKICKRDYAARTEYWTRIRQISISRWADGLAIGLVEDGTCMIAKRPVRYLCENFRQSFDRVNNTVKAWTDVVQVEASDAFFALRRDGTVEYVSLCAYPQDYAQVTQWRDVVKIKTGIQNSVFGITRDGKVLFAGRNTRNCGDAIARYNQVVDVCPTGSECEAVYLLLADGRVVHARDPEKNTGSMEKYKCLDGHFHYRIFALTQTQRLAELCGPDSPSVFPGDYRITSFAVGDHDYGQPFVIAVAQTRDGCPAHGGCEKTGCQIPSQRV